MKEAESVDELLARVVRETKPRSQGIHDVKLSMDPVVRCVDAMLDDAIDMHASDIHIEPYGEQAWIRMRVDGCLTVWHRELPREAMRAFIARIKVMARLDTTEKRLPLAGRFSYENHDRSIDIRVETVPFLGGEGAVLRILDGGSGLAVSDLGFSRRNLDLFMKLINKPGGMLLLAGPTNSGKTTTLYAALRELADDERSIVTIEDPPEYHMKGVSQVQVDRKAGLDFASALKAVLRADPDTVMIGEIRDGETAKTAVRAALSGRRIFSTVHTGRAAGVIPRMLEMGVAPYLLASALSGVAAQRLLRRAEGRGRIAIQEIYGVDDDMRRAILDRRDESYIEELAEQNGMQTMQSDGMDKAAQGLVTKQEVKRVLYGGI